jgi:hypothetical protein
LTAKEVREKLLKEEEGWKVPAERRIAKFVKRQHSRKANKKKSDEVNGRNGMIFRFFGTDGKSKSPTIDKQPPESHPRNATTEDEVSVSEKERKGGFRRIFAPHSPKKRMSSSQAGPAPESPSKDTEDGSVGSPDTLEADALVPEVTEAEVDVDSRPVDGTTEAEANNPPVVETTEAQAYNPPATETPEAQADIDVPPPSATNDVVQENDCASLLEANEPQTMPDQNKAVKLAEEITSFEVPAAETTENAAVQKAVVIVVADSNTETVDQVPKGLMEAYVDDNDGKTRDCDCFICAIM